MRTKNLSGVDEPKGQFYGDYLNLLYQKSKEEQEQNSTLQTLKEPLAKGELVASNEKALANAFKQPNTTGAAIGAWFKKAFSSDSAPKAQRSSITPNTSWSADEDKARAFKEAFTK